MTHGTKAELRGRVVGEIIDLDAVKTWIDHCQGNHTSDAGCARAWERVEGLRLVDCQRRSIISADLDEVTEYATLSYAHDDTQETTSSEAADVLPKNLPPLFQDAQRIEARKLEPPCMVHRGLDIQRTSDIWQNAAVLIDKDMQWTSHDVCKKLRGLLQMKKVCYLSISPIDLMG